MKTIIVWDIPTRVFHWTLVASFTGLFLTGDSERWREVHVLLGYTLVALLTFRVLWGFVGTRHARFTSFVQGPAAVRAYLAALLSREPQRHVGHNPAGAVAILLLIATGLLTGATGWLTYQEIGGEWLEELHEFAANFMLAVVVVHVIGVLASSILHRENLIKAMWTGRKRGHADEGIRSRHALVGLLLMAGVAALWTWTLADGPVPRNILLSASDLRDGDDD